MWVCIYYSAHVEINFPVSIFSSHHMSPGDQTQVVGLGNRHLYPLSYLASPAFLAFIT